MSVKLMSLVYDAHFYDIQFKRKKTKKTGEEVILDVKVLASTAKSVAVALADHANDEGEGAYPGLTKIEDKTELSRNAVISTLEALKNDGVIVYIGLSKYGTNNYTISKKKLAEMVVRPRQERRKLVKPLPSASEAAAPDSSINRHSQPSFEPPLALESADAQTAPLQVPENYPMDWQIAGNVEHLIVPDEGEIFTSDARSFASLIAMNNADLEPLAFQFMLSANKLPANKDIKFWRKAFRGYADNKTRPATAKDIREAVKMHIGRNLSIKNPLSIEWAVTEIITPTPKAETKNEPKAFDGIRKFLLNHAED